MRFEDLDVWKRSARLSADIYKHFANCKDFGFKDQITRSSYLYRQILQKAMNDLQTKIQSGFYIIPKVLQQN